jgi:ribosome-interacting GTPase 1
LIQGLQLEDVRWLTARKQDKVSTFRSRLTGAAAVILLTKVIGHKHNDVRDMCREMEIPCAQTRVSSGYSVNQIASVILEQVSDQLSSQCAGQLI